MPCKPVPYDKIDLCEHLWSTQVSTRPRVLSLPFGAFQASKLVTAGDVIARTRACFPYPAANYTNSLGNLEPGYVVPVSR